MSKSMRFSVIMKEALIEVAASGEFECCIDWPYATSHNGYGHCLWNGKIQRVNRIVCEMAHGPAPKDKPLALHKCGNAGCISAFCLYWGDHADNYADAVRHNTAARGEKIGNSKLKENEVCEIRAAYETGCQTLSQIADAYGVTTDNVRALVSGKTWLHVDCEVAS